jgi:hypothetical protein
MLSRAGDRGARQGLSHRAGRPSRHGYGIGWAEAGREEIVDGGLRRHYRLTEPRRGSGSGCARG